MSSPMIHVAPFKRLPVPFSKTPLPNLTPALPLEVLRAEVELRLIRKDDTPTDEQVAFRIDTGADITQLSLEKAQHRWKVKVGVDSGYVERTTASQRDWVKVFHGSIRVLFPGCDEPFELRCLFIEGLPDKVPPLLGLHSTLDFVRIRFDKTALPNAPNGAAIFERYEAPT